MNTEKWHPRRSWQDYDGTAFFEPEFDDDRARMMAQPFVGIGTPSGVSIVTAHDFFKFKPGIAEQICREHNAHPALLAACEAAMAYCPIHVQDQLRSAIAAARGEK